MSTLTKILIVLLTISSIFLCGIVVTYVSNAENWKKQYSDLKVERDTFEQNDISLKKQLKESRSKATRLQANLNNEIAELKMQLEELEGKLKKAERDKATLLQRVDKFAAEVETFTQTNKQQRQQFEKTFDELNKVKAEKIKQEKQLNETAADLLRKMAIIDTLKTDKKQLLEEKIELQNRLNKLLQQLGEVSAPPVPVTTEKDRAKPAPKVTVDIGLNGLVTDVDLKNSMAGISIGKADGVKEGMKFYVTRGKEFICEILIIDVNTEESAGFLEHVQQPPKIGDNVSTNL